ncbi:MAG: DUF2760 domain-containing protein [Pirellulales bacterium]
MHLLIAFKAFFLVLFNGAVARLVADVLRRRHEEPRLPEAKREAIAELPSAPAKPTAPKPARSEAITLLAALQREGRFVDFLKEVLSGFRDAQRGAVARDLHRDCGKVVERMFAIQPILSDAEGASVEVPSGFDAGRYRLVGNVSGTPPFRGALVHHGWQATACELPAWVGGEASSRVIAPIEVEVK